MKFEGISEAINVKRTVNAVMKRSPILKEIIEKGQCGIVGGFHDISTGEVSFYQDTMLGFSEANSDTQPF